MLGVIGAAAIVLILLGAFGSISGAVSGGNTTTINSTTINSNTTVQSTTIQSTTIQSTTSVTSQFFTTDVTSVFDTTQITSQTTVVTTITSNSCAASSYGVSINGSGHLGCANVPQFDPIFFNNFTSSSISVTGTAYGTSGIEFTMNANTLYSFTAYGFVSTDSGGYAFEVPAASIPTAAFLYYICVQGETQVLGGANPSCTTLSATPFGGDTSATDYTGAFIMHGAITTSPTSSCPCHFIVNMASLTALKTVTINAGQWLTGYVSP